MCLSLRCLCCLTGPAGDGCAEDVLDTETELALGFLDNLLLGTPAAPLRKVLMESGLGEAIIGGGMDDDLRQPAFSIGLKVRPRHTPLQPGWIRK